MHQFGQPQTNIFRNIILHHCRCCITYETCAIQQMIIIYLKIIYHSTTTKHKVIIDISIPALLYIINRYHSNLSALQSVACGIFILYRNIPLSQDCPNNFILKKNVSSQSRTSQNHVSRTQHAAFWNVYEQPAQMEPTQRCNFHTPLLCMATTSNATPKSTMFCSSVLSLKIATYKIILHTLNIHDG